MTRFTTTNGITTIAISGRFTTEDKKSDDYAYLPFEVPVGTERIDVSYDYSRSSMAQSRAGDETVLDLGVFGPDSSSRKPGEFRGWSGGARSGFFITEQDATPGYLPGSIPAGIWYVFIGLYKIASSGCDYMVTVKLWNKDGVATEEIEPVSQAETERVSFERRTPGTSDHASGTRYGKSAHRSGWYVGDLQSHTYHSDAKASVGEIAYVAADRGLDFLAITDHNTISHLRDLPSYSSSDLLLIPAMEITTYYGHANVWGLSEWIDFRCRSAGDIYDRIRDAHSQNALVSVNHPYTDCPWSYGWIEGLDALEVWWALWNRGDVAALAYWDELLSTGKRITGVGGSDRHQPEKYDPHYPHQVGTPATRVKADELSTEAILRGIRLGRVVIAATPEGPWLDMSVIRSDGTSAGVGEDIIPVPDETLTIECSVTGDSDDTVEIVGNGEIIAARPTGTGGSPIIIEIPTERLDYIRAQLVAGKGTNEMRKSHYPLVKALTNPVYLRSRREEEGVSSNARK